MLRRPCRSRPAGVGRSSRHPRLRRASKTSQRHRRHDAAPQVVRTLIARPAECERRRTSLRGWREQPEGFDPLVLTNTTRFGCQSCSMSVFGPSVTLVTPRNPSASKIHGSLRQWPSLDARKAVKTAKRRRRSLDASEHARNPQRRFNRIGGVATRCLRAPERTQGRTAPMWAPIRCS